MAEVCIQRRSVDDISQHTGSRVDAHGCHAFGAAGGGSRNVIHRRAYRAVVNRRGDMHPCRGCSTDRDFDRRRGRTSAVVPFLDHGVVGSRAQIQRSIQACAVNQVDSHSGSGVDSHSRNAFGAARRGGCHKLHAGANCTVVGWGCDQDSCPRRYSPTRNQKDCNSSPRDTLWLFINRLSSWTSGVKDNFAT